MNKKFEVLGVDFLVDYLKKSGRVHPIKDKDYQLSTNHCWVHEMNNGEVILLPNKYLDPRGKGRIKGLLVKDIVTFRKMIENDYFPIESYKYKLFEEEQDRIKNLSQEINYYFNFLQYCYKKTEDTLTKSVGERLFSQAIGRKIKGVFTDKERMALMIVTGELLRRLVEGKWILEKKYGVFNPYYKPNILTCHNTVILVDSIGISFKGNINFVKHNFDKYSKSQGKNRISLEKFETNRTCIILD